MMSAIVFIWLVQWNECTWPQEMPPGAGFQRTRAFQDYSVAMNFLKTLPSCTDEQGRAISPGYNFQRVELEK